MSVVCLPNCDFLSETSRMLAVYRELEALGAEPRMATHGGAHEFVLRQAGVPYELIEPRLTPADARRLLDSVTLRSLKTFYARSVLEAHVRAEIEFFREHDARAVLVGFTLSTALSARAAGVPLVATHLGSYVPPAGEILGFPCSEVFDGPLTGLLPDSWLERLAGRFFTRTRVQIRPFNAIARRLGIATEIRSMLDLLMGDLTLVTDVPEILGVPEEEMEAWRPTDLRQFRPNARLAYAGAIFAKLFGDVPPDVAAFLDTDRPRVYVALASTRPEYLRQVREALAGMDVRAVIASTVHEEPLRPGENVLVRDFLPSHLVMPLCDLAIIHGGQGSVQTAISAGVPVIGFPLQPEQNFNLRLLEKHGAGCCMSLRSLARGRLPGAIADVLGDPGYGTAMKRLQAWQASRNGAREAARRIVDLLE